MKSYLHNNKRVIEVLTEELLVPHGIEVANRSMREIGIPGRKYCDDIKVFEFNESFQFARQLYRNEKVKRLETGLYRILLVGDTQRGHGVCVEPDVFMGLHFEVFMYVSANKELEYIIPKTPDEVAHMTVALKKVYDDFGFWPCNTVDLCHLTLL